MCKAGAAQDRGGWQQSRAHTLTATVSLSHALSRSLFSAHSSLWLSVTLSLSLSLNRWHAQTLKSVATRARPSSYRREGGGSGALGSWAS